MNQDSEALRTEVRHVALGLVFCSFSLTLSIGIVVIDILPDLFGVLYFLTFLRRCRGEKLSWPLRLCGWYGVAYGISMLVQWYRLIPAMQAFMERWGVLLWQICLLILLWYVFEGLIELSRQAGREDYVQSGLWFQRVLAVSQCLVIVVVFWQAHDLEGIAIVLSLLVRLAMAAYVSNSQVILPQPETA
ncbi:MAG: hypothetical protein ACOX7F_03330 [Eubacteriales bacterium]|jgi:hypothetical protein